MLSLREIARRIDAGESTAAAELRRSEELIAAGDGELRAFASRAARMEPGTGPLAGVACGVKDIIDTAELPTGMGSPIYEGWRPRADAAIVMALKQAGASLAGKTHTTAFAFLDPAPTHNPHDPQASPGGSSAGSAAAVAAGMIPLAVGTQTGGSVIRPASYCGVAALKPSFALLPTIGVKAFSWSLDTLGLMAASADDLGFAIAALTGRPELDAAPAQLGGLRIGIVRQGFAGAAEPASEAALRRACQLAEAAGARLIDLAEEPAFTDAFHAHAPLQEFEAARALAWEYAAHREVLPPKLRTCLEGARLVTPARYDEARALSRRGRAACRELFDTIDVMLTYAAPGEAPATLASTGDSKFNRLWTLLGTPCLGIPLVRGERGLPVSVQIIGPFGADERVIAVAKALEKLTAPSDG